MKKIADEDIKKSILALGMFDGVHLAHQALICRTVELSKAHNADAVVCTFSNHPAAVFGINAPLILTFDDRRALIEKMGAGVYSEEFTKMLSMRSPLEFLDSMFDKFIVAGVVCGYDYRFGKDREGNKDLLKNYCARKETFLEVIPEIDKDGSAISSTRIRECIAVGDLDAAANLLGRNVFYSGIVKQNLGVGAKIGFATANLIPQGVITPPNGVYVSTTHTPYGSFDSITNIGIRPTINNEGKLMIETHLLGCEINVYDKHIKVEILCKIRPEIAFGSLAELSDQIAQDIEKSANMRRKI